MALLSGCRHHFQTIASARLRSLALACARLRSPPLVSGFRFFIGETRKIAPRPPPPPAPGPSLLYNYKLPIVRPWRWLVHKRSKGIFMILRFLLSEVRRACLARSASALAISPSVFMLLRLAPRLRGLVATRATAPRLRGHATAWPRERERARPHARLGPTRL